MDRASVSEAGGPRSSRGRGTKLQTSRFLDRGVFLFGGSFFTANFANFACIRYNIHDLRMDALVAALRSDGDAGQRGLEAYRPSPFKYTGGETG